MAPQVTVAVVCSQCGDMEKVCPLIAGGASLTFRVTCCGVANRASTAGVSSPSISRELDGPTPIISAFVRLSRGPQTRWSPPVVQPPVVVPPIVARPHRTLVLSPRPPVVCVRRRPPPSPACCMALFQSGSGRVGAGAGRHDRQMRLPPPSVRPLARRPDSLLRCRYPWQRKAPSRRR